LVLASHMEQAIPATTLEEAIGPIAAEVNLSARLEALMASLDRSAPKADLKRRYPDPQAWTRYVVRSLDEPATREEAFRALSILVKDFVNLPTLDARIKNAVHKARAAADRQDLDRLKRALSKLSQDARTITDLPLPKPEILIYLATTSPRARANVASLIFGEPADVGSEAVVAAELDVAPTGRTAAHTPEAHGAVQPAAVPVPAIPRTITGTPVGIHELRTALRQLVAAHPSGPPAWDAGTIRRQVEAEVPEVEWPSFASLGTVLPGQLKLLRGLIENSERITIDVETLSDARETLNSLYGGLERIAHLLTSVDEAMKTAKQSAIAAAANVGMQQREVAAEAVANLDSPTTYGEAIRTIRQLARQSRERQLEEYGALSELVQTIGNRVGGLPAEEIGRFRESTTTLFGSLDRAGLEGLLGEVDARNALLVAEYQKTATIAENVAALLEVAQNTNIGPEDAARCLEAVRVGDSKRALQAVGSMLAAGAKTERAPMVEIAEAITAPVTRTRQPSDLPPITAIPSLERFEPRNAITAQYARQQRRGNASPDEIVALLQAESDPSRAVQLSFELLASTVGTQLAAGAMFRLLEWRAMEELSRGSVLGAVEHGLDIVELASRATDGGEAWFRRGVAVLALIPSIPPVGVWGPRAAIGLREVLSGEDPLHEGLARLFQGVAFAQAVAERFMHAPMKSFVPKLASAMFALALEDEQRAHLRDELAFGVANGTRYGSDEVVRTFFIELATAADCGDQTRSQLKALLGNASIADRRAVGQIDKRVLGKLPDWLKAGVESYMAARAELNETQARVKDADKPFTKPIVPRSVAEAKGFVFREGVQTLQVALLVSARTPSIFNAEFVLRAAENRDWLERDLVTYIGAPGAQHLLQLTLPLSRELRRDDASLSMTYSFRWMEAGSAKAPERQTGTVTIPLTQPRQLVIDDYPGATGTPLLLVQENLELSSSWVRNALKDILDQLGAGKPAAFLITGRRRRGKTSILSTVKGDRDVQKHFVITADSLEDVPFRNLQQAFSHLGRILDVSAVRMGVVMPSLADQLRYSGGWPDIQGWLSELTGKLKQPTKLLLLIDEFQKWLSALDDASRTRVLGAIRGLHNRPEGSALSIALVLSGLSNIKSYIKSSADFDNAFSKKIIGPFNKDEAERLIRSNRTIEFDKRAVTALQDFSGGNPFLISLLGNKVVEWLRQQQRPYCFRDDVDFAVRDELGSEDSRGWSFVQYLLKEGEEDHAPEIEELPALVSVAWCLQQRGPARAGVRFPEIIADLEAANVDFDQETLEKDLASCVEDELLVRDGDRYAFGSRCLREWLAARHEAPLPVRRQTRETLVLNRYRILENLPRGGQASSVFTAVDTHLHNQTVVLKIYARDQGGGASTLVDREARALTKVDHSGVIRVLTYGEDPVWGHVLVLEHAHGDDLRRILRNPQPATGVLAGATGDAKTQVGLLIAITHALAECHRAGVVHKDIKPEHILVRQESGVWAPKIIDFGLAAEVSPAADAKVPTVAPFSAYYVAPEKLRGAPREAPADIYSLGVVAFELLTGSLPFGDGALTGQASAMRDMRALRPDAPLRLMGLVERMLADDPRDRPTAVSVASELEVALEPQDWAEFWAAGTAAFNADQRDVALRSFQQAVFAAPLTDRKTPRYLELLEELLMILEEDPAVLRVCEQLTQPLLACCLGATEADHGRRQTLMRTFCEVILHAPKAVGDGTTAAALVHDLCTYLLGVEPMGVAVSAVELLLSSAVNPVAWEQRDAIHEVGFHYRAGALLKEGTLEAWCLAASRRLREHNASLLDCQQWLRRAERLGVAANRDYAEERERVEREITKTAHGVRLPRAANSQEDPAKSVGDGERGHLMVERITGWVLRLYRRHPYVQAVRRVSKDATIPPRPNRILDINNIARHAKAAVGVVQERIVPAVLDQSFCVESCALRINILLEEGCTIQEREAAMEELRKDLELFPNDG
jgi:hypothetical protein